MNGKKSKNSTVPNYDIMIVGGGPAGISTWLHLQKNNPELAKKTILIEKEKYPREKVCGGGIGAWSGMILNQLNIKIDIPSIPISDIDFIYRKEKISLHQPNQFIMVQREEFDHMLAKTAVNRGLDLNENEYLIDIKRQNGIIEVKTNKGLYKVKVLVGADGALSLVRKKMQLANKPHIAPTLEVFAPMNPEYDLEYNSKRITVDLTQINNGLQGYIWHCPCIKNNKPYMCHGLADFRIYKDRQKADMKDILTKTLKSRNKDIKQIQLKGHPIRWFSDEDKISQPNIILVGDAVGIEPAFGGGIHFALSYGSVAARTIEYAFQKNDFSFKNYKKDIQSHLIGKWISFCRKIANDMYDGKIHPLEGAKKVFTIDQDKLKRMVS